MTTVQIYFRIESHNPGKKKMIRNCETDKQMMETLPSDIRLSQLTCKILETGTNANTTDLLAPRTAEGFSSELTLTMVGCPEQSEYIRCGL